MTTFKTKSLTFAKANPMLCCCSLQASFFHFVQTSSGNKFWFKPTKNNNKQKQNKTRNTTTQTDNSSKQKLYFLQTVNLFFVYFFCFLFCFSFISAACRLIVRTFTTTAHKVSDSSRIMCLRFSLLIYRLHVTRSCTITRTPHRQNRQKAAHLPLRQRRSPTSIQAGPPCHHQTTQHIL